MTVSVPLALLVPRAVPERWMMTPLSSPSGPQLTSIAPADCNAREDAHDLTRAPGLLTEVLCLSPQLPTGTLIEEIADGKVRQYARDRTKNYAEDRLSAQVVNTG